MIRARILTSSLFVLAFAICAWAQQSPLDYATAVVDACGRVGQLLNQSSGTGQRNGIATQYRSASFEIECEDAHIGQIDIQTADNESSAVSYRQYKGESNAQTLRGTDTTALVEQGIRGACSCGPAGGF